MSDRTAARPTNDGASPSRGRETAAVRIARAMVEEISTGAFPVGSALPSEAELARRFEVSRPSLREALSALHFAGYVDSRKGAGSVVISAAPVPGAARDPRAPASYAEVVDLLEARLVLEPAVLRLAAHDPDPAALDAAEEAVRGMRLVTEDKVRADTDHRLHALIADTCRNKLLVTDVRELLDRASGPFWRATQESAWADAGLLRRWQDHHETVVAALVDGDADTAARTARDHLLSAVRTASGCAEMPPSGRQRLNRLLRVYG